uniref:Reverse transcriptase domain-containing protein n=1 Tax=Tanacetum cinerariifolium TaxID=118510 RepID=A0A6L2NQJ3_TANCI|nr:reverse transcriptase domain-containing protein [Tanacetum cinerariifolium]
MNFTPPDAYSDGTIFRVVTEVSRANIIENQVMAIFTISISLDSSEESVGTTSRQVLWFDRIPTTVPATTPTIDPPIIHDDTSLIPTKTPTISLITSTIPPTTPTTHYTSPFIHTDSFDDDTPDTPPSPTHETPLVKPIPYGRPYCYHPNRPVHMMTAKKRIGPLPTHLLFVRHSFYYSSSDYFTFDDSSRDLPSDLSSETSSDSYLDVLSDSSFDHSSSDHSSPALPSGIRSSHQLCSSVPSIPYSSTDITERLSYSSSVGPLRIRNSDSVTDLKVSSDKSSESSIPKETGLRVDVNVEEVEMSARGMVMVSDDEVTHPVVLDDIHEPAQEEGAIEVTYETLGDLVQRFHYQTVEILVHRVRVIKSIRRDQGHRIVAMGQQSVVLSERISKLEWDNTRLRGMLDVASQRVTHFQHRELRTMPNTLSGATMTREAVDNLIARRVAETLEAHDDARNLEPLAEGGDDQGDENGDDYEGGNGGGNINGNENGGVNGNRNGGGNGNGNGNVIAAAPTKLQDAIRIANNLMDQKMKGYARSAENNRRFDNPPMDNHGQQPAFKRQNDPDLENLGGNYKRVGHMARDGMTTVAPINQRALVGNQSSIVFYECGRPRHYRKDFPKLRNRNRENKTRNKAGNNEATTKAYAIIGGGANLDSMFSWVVRSTIIFPIELGSFDVIIGMDWLVKYHAVIACEEKIVRLGAVLMQKEKVIAYTSRQLKVYEKSYITHDLELDAVVLVLKMWRHYLYGTKGVVFTDYKSLQHIIAQKELNMRQRWWLELLSDYDYSECSIGSQKEENFITEYLHEDESLEKLTRQYLNEIVSRHGVPDRDGRSTLHFWRSLHKALGTRLDMSTTYHPQTDGQSERTIQTLEDMLRACVLNFGKSWDRYLMLVEFSYNNSYHTSIKAIPFEALYEHLDSESSSAVIAMNSSNSAKISSSRRVPLMEWGILLPLSRRALKSSSRISSITSILKHVSPFE